MGILFPSSSRDSENIMAVISQKAGVINRVVAVLYDCQDHCCQAGHCALDGIEKPGNTFMNKPGSIYSSIRAVA
ncbi:unnamed protein product [Arctia plantaginis]|uniref:Uncharacterized protein n=1 Tax=Arctia plantaginis TaxID=874455 RepID=A0A8S1AYV4_ARCPL|nr:unnamed protein product [Arctia plantaginis]